MEFARVIRKRRMCREFLPQDVNDDQVGAILELAARFPSAGHTQPQEFIVVRDEDRKRALGQAALQQMFLGDAPVVIVTVSDTKRSASRYGERGVTFYSVIDGAFASLLVLLAAIDQGLEAAFVGAFDDERVQRILELPDHVRPIGIIPVGHCGEAPDKHPRRRRSDIVHGEHYGRVWEADLSEVAR